ncbi:hypothetical protein LguiA_012610 [Lonicera macranthoides]
MGIIQGRKIQMLLKKMKNKNNSKGYTSLHDHQQISIHKQTVPSGHFPIYVGEEFKRYAVPVAYLSSRWMQNLLNKFEDEIQGGQPIVLPCSVDAFERYLHQSPGEVRYDTLVIVLVGAPKGDGGGGGGRWAMASSSSLNSSNYGNNHWTWTCKCGYPVPIKVSWTRENLRRRFAGCRNYRVGPCKFFKWIDDDDLKMYKDLHSRHEDLKQMFEAEKKKIEDLVKIIKLNKEVMARKEKGINSNFKKTIVILVCILILWVGLRTERMENCYPVICLLYVLTVWLNGNGVFGP